MSLSELKKLDLAIDLLLELRNKYPETAEHEPTISKTTPFKRGEFNKVLEIICSCGEVIKYKKPLNSIVDFECPAERKAILARKIQSPKKQPNKTKS